MNKQATIRVGKVPTDKDPVVFLYTDGSEDSKKAIKLLEESGLVYSHYHDPTGESFASDWKLPTVNSGAGSFAGLAGVESCVGSKLY